MSTNRLSHCLPIVPSHACVAHVETAGAPPWLESYARRRSKTSRRCSERQPGEAYFVTLSMSVPFSLLSHVDAQDIERWRKSDPRHRR